MEAVKSVKLESIIEFVRKKFDSTQGLSPELREQLTRIRERVTGYEQAVTGRGVAELAVSVGMDGVTLPDVDHAALALLEAVERLPELRSSERNTLPSVPAPCATTREQVIPVLIEDEEGPAIARFPTIAARLGDKGRMLYLVGGRTIQAKLEWVRTVLLGQGHENDDIVRWIATEDDADSRASTRVVNQMKAGTILAVVTFPEFMAHVQTDVLVRGGRECGIPVVYAGKGGQAQFMNAFEQIESMLAKVQS